MVSAVERLTVTTEIRWNLLNWNIYRGGVERIWCIRNETLNLLIPGWTPGGRNKARHSSWNCTLVKHWRRCYLERMKVCSNHTTRYSRDFNKDCKVYKLECFALRAITQLVEYPRKTGEVRGSIPFCPTKNTFFWKNLIKTWLFQKKVVYLYCDWLRTRLVPDNLQSFT